MSTRSSLIDTALRDIAQYAEHITGVGYFPREKLVGGQSEWQTPEDVGRIETEPRAHPDAGFVTFGGGSDRTVEYFYDDANACFVLRADGDGWHLPEAIVSGLGLDVAEFYRLLLQGQRPSRAFRSSCGRVPVTEEAVLAEVFSRKTRSWFYYTDAKAGWGKGAWDREPDRIQWWDGETGYVCLIRRLETGALAGYVGVAPSHALFEKDWMRCAVRCSLSERGRPCEHMPALLLETHGGISYSGKGTFEGGLKGIGHVSEGPEPKVVWWYGFTCDHTDDYSPALHAAGGSADRYRDLPYVRTQVENLALQLRDLQSMERRESFREERATTPAGPVAGVPGGGEGAGRLNRERL